MDPEPGNIGRERFNMGPEPLNMDRNGSKHALNVATEGVNSSK